MQNELLEQARQQAEKADASIRAAALLRIARVEAHGDHARARQTLLEGLDAIQNLSESVRQYLFVEARMVAAAASPELLAAIPVADSERPEPFGPFQSTQIIQTMLMHGHLDAAFDNIIQQDDPESFPYPAVGAVLHRLNTDNIESPARRIKLLRHAVELWRQRPSSPERHRRRRFGGGRRGFVGLFGDFWKDFPPDEALSIARAIVDRATQETDSPTSSGYSNEIHFSSSRQDTLFQILHVLRHLDPALAQSLIDSHDQLAVAVRRYPNGLETMHEESEAAAKRMQAEGASCQGGGVGYVLSGDPADFPRQRRVIEAARAGNFGPSIEDALNKYREDTSPDAPNYAPREYWPSTGAFRSSLYQAGQRLGMDAASFLDQVPDADLRLFASIEFAAALANAPASSITTMKNPNPPGSPRFDSRIVSARCAIGTSGAKPPGPPMRASDGRLIRCPKCSFQPSDDDRWSCKCGHVWNTFRTTGKCPSCSFQWEETACPRCGEMSDHRAWYVPEL